MLNKLYASALFTLFIGTTIFAQNPPPAPEKSADTTIKRLILTSPAEKGYLGVSVQDISSKNLAEFGLREVRGVGILEVSENSPAAKAGLKAGDVIVEIDGKTVKNDFDLVRAIGVKKEGDVQLTIVREKKRQIFTVTPEESEEDFRFKTREFEELFKKSAS